MSKRTEKPFNNPFLGLKLDKPATSKQEQAPKAAGRPPALSAELDEGALFRSAVGEVSPVRGSNRRERENGSVDVGSLKIVDPEQEAFTQLCELVAQRGPLDLTDTDEYIEGHAPGLDARIIRRLRKGHYSVQAHVDLHGHTRDEAKQELLRFVEDSYRKQHRCILVVHGRGLHSKDQIPVLKQGLRAWLSSGRISRYVLAFTSAQRHDGGLGAVYVLLRR